jgi:glycerol-3-phosphate responsive antiterminator
MNHHQERLQAIDVIALKMGAKQVRKFSPDIIEDVIDKYINFIY